MILTLFLENSIKNFNKLFNIGLKKLSNWLNANKFFLNVKKKSKLLSLNLEGKNMNHVNVVSTKLTRTKAILFKGCPPL